MDLRFKVSLVSKMIIISSSVRKIILLERWFNQLRRRTEVG
ncbi:MAG: hypothetical protein ACTS41_01185 [Candidatus Hodgkinia cicadicola]